MVVVKMNAHEGKVQLKARGIDLKSDTVLLESKK